MKSSHNRWTIAVTRPHILRQKYSYTQCVKLDYNRSMKARSLSVSAKEAAHVAGFTVQMLDYLEREGVFEREQARTEALAKARHHGTRRRYDFRDLIVLRAISGLLEKGVSV